MYAHITSNVWKSVLLVIAFMAVLIGLGYLFSEVTGFPYILPVAVVIAVVSSIGSYYYSDRIVLGMSRARPANREEHAFMINSVEGLALAAGIPVPRIYVIDDTAPNAFATGRDPQHAVICVTTGLMQKLDRIELEAVIGHEMAHIKDYDIRFMALVAVLAGTVVLIADWLLRSIWWGGGRRRRGSEGGNPIILVVALLAAIIAPIVATLIQLSISRKREYLADAQGALLTRYPDGLASALAKISADPEPLEAANKATAHLYIYNPLRDHGGFLNSLFSTHPPVEDRIRRLKAM